MNMSKWEKSKSKGVISMNSKILAQSARSGFSTGKLLALVIAVGVIGGGIWLCRDFLKEEEKKVRQDVPCRYLLSRLGPGRRHED